MARGGGVKARLEAAKTLVHETGVRTVQLPAAFHVIVCPIVLVAWSCLIVSHE